MPVRHADLTPWARGGLALLCLLLAASIATRISLYRHESGAGAWTDWDASGAPVDLGAGIRLSRSDARSRTLAVASCPVPVAVDFVAASPYGADPALVGAVRPDDRVFYVYRGWIFGNRFATARLNAIYFARRAYARLAMRKSPAPDELAVKIAVPADCAASPEAVMAILRLPYEPVAPSATRD